MEEEEEGLIVEGVPTCREKPLEKPYQWAETALKAFQQWLDATKDVTKGDVAQNVLVHYAFDIVRFCARDTLEGSVKKLLAVLQGNYETSVLGDGNEAANDNNAENGKRERPSIEPVEVDIDFESIVTKKACDLTVFFDMDLLTPEAARSLLEPYSACKAVSAMSWDISSRLSEVLWLPLEYNSPPAANLLVYMFRHVDPLARKTHLWEKDPQAYLPLALNTLLIGLEGVTSEDFPQRQIDMMEHAAFFLVPRLLAALCALRDKDLRVDSPAEYEACHIAFQGCGDLLARCVDSELDFLGNTGRHSAALDFVWRAELPLFITVLLDDAAPIPGRSFATAIHLAAALMRFQITWGHVLEERDDPRLMEEVGHLREKFPRYIELLTIYNEMPMEGLVGDGDVLPVNLYQALHSTVSLCNLRDPVRDQLPEDLASDYDAWAKTVADMGLLRLIAKVTKQLMDQDRRRGGDVPSAQGDAGEGALLTAGDPAGGASFTANGAAESTSSAGKHPGKSTALVTNDAADSTSSAGNNAGESTVLVTEDGAESRVSAANDADYSTSLAGKDAARRMLLSGVHYKYALTLWARVLGHVGDYPSFCVCGLREGLVAVGLDLLRDAAHGCFDLLTDGADGRFNSPMYLAACEMVAELVADTEVASTERCNAIPTGAMPFLLSEVQGAPPSVKWEVVQPFKAVAIVTEDVEEFSRCGGREWLSYTITSPEEDPLVRADACCIFLTLIGIDVATNIQSFGRAVVEMRGYQRNMALYGVEQAADASAPNPRLAKEIKLSVQDFFHALPAILRNAVQRHKEEGTDPTLVIPYSEFWRTPAHHTFCITHLICGFMKADEGYRKAARQAGLIPVLLDVLESFVAHMRDPVESSLTILLDIAFVHKSGERASPNPEFLKAGGVLVLARLLSDIEDNPDAVRDDDEGNGPPCSWRLARQVMNLLRAMFKHVSCSSGLRREIADSGALDVCANLLAYQSKRTDMQGVPAACLIIGSCEVLDDPTDADVAERARVIVQALKGIITNYLAFLTEVLLQLDPKTWWGTHQNHVTFLEACSSMLRTLSKARQYKTAMQADPEFVRLLESLIGEGKTHAHLNGCLCCGRPNGDGPIQDLTALRRHLQQRSKEKPASLALDPALYDQARKAADKAAAELIMAEETAKSRKEEKAAKKKEKKAKAHQDRLEPVPPGSSATSAHTVIGAAVSGTPSGSSTPPASTARAACGASTPHGGSMARASSSSSADHSEHASRGSSSTRELQGQDNLHSAVLPFDVRHPTEGHPGTPAFFAAADGDDPSEWQTAERRTGRGAGRVRGGMLQPGGRRGGVATSGGRRGPASDDARVFVGPRPPAPTAIPPPPPLAPLIFEDERERVGPNRLRLVMEPPVPDQARAPRPAPAVESPGAASAGNPVLDVFAALTLGPRPPPAADGSDVSGPTTPSRPGPLRPGNVQAHTAAQVDGEVLCGPSDSPAQPASPHPVTPRDPWARGASRAAHSVPVSPATAPEAAHASVKNGHPATGMPPGETSLTAGRSVATAAGAGTVGAAAGGPVPRAPLTRPKPRRLMSLATANGQPPAPAMQAAAPPAPYQPPAAPTMRGVAPAGFSAVRPATTAVDNGGTHGRGAGGVIKSVPALATPPPVPTSPLLVQTALHTPPTPSPQSPGASSLVPGNLVFVGLANTHPPPQPVHASGPTLVFGQFDDVDATLVAPTPPLAPTPTAPVPLFRSLALDDTLGLGVGPAGAPSPVLSRNGPTPTVRPRRPEDVTWTSIPGVAATSPLAFGSVPMSLASPRDVGQAPLLDAAHAYGNGAAAADAGGLPLPLSNGVAAHGPRLEEGQPPSGAGGQVTGMDCLRFRWEDLLPIFTCPLSKEVMRDPVLALDGHTYERTALVDWLMASAERVSPMKPGVELTFRLVPNVSLRALIAACYVPQEQEE